VAAEITGFDVVVPEDGNKKEGGEKDDSGLHRIGESIARVRKGEEGEECKSLEATEFESDGMVPRSLHCVPQTTRHWGGDNTLRGSAG
jgi:hypothetical protein